MKSVLIPGNQSSFEMLQLFDKLRHQNLVVRFSRGEIFLRYSYLSSQAENWKFPPRGEMDILTFLYDI